MGLNETTNGYGSFDLPSSLNVPLRLGDGPPTREELLVHYPAKFTWIQLKTFVNSGDLGLLKRDKKLQIRYNAWAKGIKEQHGSIVNYLINHRLQWGKPDTLSLLASALHDRYPVQPDDPSVTKSQDTQLLPPLPKGVPEYFTADISPTSELISIIQNDWPYSVPPEIEHTLVWTRVPIFHADLIDPSVHARIQQDGLCGFTGSSEPPPSPSTLHECLPALAEWGITMDRLIRSPPASEDEEALVKRAGSQVGEFVLKRWNDEEWETAWFVNPPRLQSVPGLAHIHVFARKKSLEDSHKFNSPEN
ncbi:hypothetical protein BJ138DRAFT_434967 [Hygrophoropsis aurantiaca]|uniref:Uncharacterized protein n=1 Tax=Hygrophoropsis aurantiaca TaxID=72124 RepID=A0ACB8AL51_9AGAM|nr:hypothetical protein BJ138DRAFT_434967 [Hygrophoropsis aurantiaca]